MLLGCPRSTEMENEFCEESGLISYGAGMRLHLPCYASQGHHATVGEGLESKDLPTISDLSNNSKSHLLSAGSLA